MTVSYTSSVFTSADSWRPNFIFVRLLGRVRGSVYKLIWHDILIYFSLYYALSFMYRFGLNEEGGMEDKSSNMGMRSPISSSFSQVGRSLRICLSTATTLSTTSR